MWQENSPDWGGGQRAKAGDFAFGVGRMCLIAGMNLRIAALAAIFTVGIGPLSQAGSKPQGEIGMVTFHLETDPSVVNPKLLFTQMDDGKQRFFLRSPEITMKSIEAFCPFPSGTGSEYGLVFQLKEPARRHLNALSIANPGKFLLAQADGRVVDGVWIDKPVNDGMIIIWKGITSDEIKLFDKVLPRIGATDKAKQKKKAK